MLLLLHQIFRQASKSNNIGFFIRRIFLLALVDLEYFQPLARFKVQKFAEVTKFFIRRIFLLTLENKFQWSLGGRGPFKMTECPGNSTG